MTNFRDTLNPVVKRVLESETTPAYHERGWRLLDSESRVLDLTHWMDVKDWKCIYTTDRAAVNAVPHLKSDLARALDEIDSLSKQLAIYEEIEKGDEQ